MERVFAFRFNTVVNYMKYFFLYHSINFDLFNSSRLMDKIKVGTSKVDFNQTEATAN